MGQAYFELSRTSIMELFCENSLWLQGEGACYILPYFIYTSYIPMK